MGSTDFSFSSPKRFSLPSPIIFCKPFQMVKTGPIVLFHSSLENLVEESLVKVAILRFSTSYFALILSSALSMPMGRL